MMYDDMNSGSGPSAMKTLFVITGVCALSFIALRIQPALGALFSYSLTSLLNLELWRPVTSIFVNDDGFLLFLQMIMLLSFGGLVARYMNWSVILALFLTGGILGNLLTSLFCLHIPNAMIFGCEGAVYSLIFASAMIAPDFQCYLLFIPFPIKMRTMAVVFLIIDLICMRFQSLGGILGAYLFMKFFMKETVKWDILDFRSYSSKKKKEHPEYIFNGNVSPKKTIVVEQGEESVDMKEADRVLEKLSRSGINSLTDEEIALLERLRKQMNSRK